MKNETRKQAALADIAAATTQGHDGAASDSVLEAKEWGFDVSRINASICLWHGTQDADVPLAAAEYLLTKCGRSVVSAHIIEGESHTLIRRHWGSILQTVIEVARHQQGASARL